MNRHYATSSNQGLFRKKVGFEECFRYFPVGNANNGISVCLTYGGNGDPLFSLVKFRGNPISTSYISLNIKEIDQLICAMQKDDFRFETAPIDSTHIVKRLDRPLVIAKKEWTGKQWTQLTLGNKCDAAVRLYLRRHRSTMRES